MKKYRRSRDHRKSDFHGFFFQMTVRAAFEIDIAS